MATRLETRPSRHRASLFLAVGIGVAACNGTQPTPGGLRPGESATCTATLSGARAGTFNCRPATTEIASDRAFFDFEALSPADGGDALAITVIIYFVGGSVPASYTQASPDGNLGGVVVTSAEGSWSTSPSGGSYQLTFASFSNAVTYPDGTLYEAEGVVDATLVPVAGSTVTGVVTLHATF